MAVRGIKEFAHRDTETGAQPLDGINTKLVVSASCVFQRGIGHSAHPGKARNSSGQIIAVYGVN